MAESEEQQECEMHVVGNDMDGWRICIRIAEYEVMGQMAYEDRVVATAKARDLLDRFREAMNGDKVILRADA